MNKAFAVSSLVIISILFVCGNSLENPAYAGSKDDAIRKANIDYNAAVSKANADKFKAITKADTDWFKSFSKYNGDIEIKKREIPLKQIAETFKIKFDADYQRSQPNANKEKITKWENDMIKRIDEKYFKELQKAEQDHFNAKRKADDIKEKAIAKAQSDENDAIRKAQITRDNAIAKAK